MRVCACGCGRPRRNSRSLYATAQCHRQEPRLVNSDELAMIEVVREDPCAYCGRRGEDWKPTIGGDHIVPVSAGGERAGVNITGACRDCNSAKGAKPLLTFLLDRSAA